MDSVKDIPGVLLSPLKFATSPKGNVLRAWRHSEEGAGTLAEAYFSRIDYQNIKGWKKHLSMTLNLVVCEGSVTFAIFDDRGENHLTRKVSLGPEIEYARLTVPPEVWVSYRGDEDSNMLINFADLIHEPTEAENLPLDHESMPIVWSTKK